MPDPAAHEARSLPLDGPTLNGTALRSTKAGLVSLGLVSFALATFGPWFNLLLGYGLMAASMAVAVVGIAWADRALHKTRRSPALTNGIYAKSGAALSIGHGIGFDGCHIRGNVLPRAVIEPFQDQQHRFRFQTNANLGLIVKRPVQSGSRRALRVAAGT